MRLLLFSQNRIPVDPRIELVIATDPRVVNWMKREGKIKRIPCLWVLGSNFESLYYGSAIQEYLSGLLSEQAEYQEPELQLPEPEYTPLELENPPPEVSESPKKVFEPNFDDV